MIVFDLLSFASLAYAFFVVPWLFAVSFADAFSKVETPA